MSMIIRHALGAAATGITASWVASEPENNLFTRIANVREAFQRRGQIADPYTALKHLKLVGSLISKPSQESAQATETFLQQNPTTPAIFRYEDGFLFAGLTPETHDPKANADILGGNYVRCPSDMIITGTTDTKKCRQLQYDLLKAFAIRTAKNNEPLSPEKPYADTLVFERTKEGIQQTGNLANMTPGAKQKIGANDFSLCLRHPISSGGQPKQVEAIIAGDTSRMACHSLFLETRTALS